MFLQTRRRRMVPGGTTRARPAKCQELGKFALVKELTDTSYYCS